MEQAYCKKSSQESSQWKFHHVNHQAPMSDRVTVPTHSPHHEEVLDCTGDATKKPKLAESDDVAHTFAPPVSVTVSTHTTDDTNEATSSTKNAKRTQKQLPSRMLIRAQWSRDGVIPYEFLRRNAKTGCPLTQLYKAIGSNCKQVGMLPASSKVMKNGWCLYSDDEGMRKTLVMNAMINPFMSARDIVYMASMGGPFGNVVLDGDGYMLNRATLLDLCKAADKRDETEGEFEAAMHKALDAWDASK